MFDSMDAWGIVVAAVAVLVSIGAAWVSWGARRDVQRYNDAQWKVTYSSEMKPGGLFILRLLNIGPTVARSVELKWDFDPLNIHSSGIKADLIEVGRHRDTTLNGFVWHPNYPNWFTLIAEKSESRYGEVTWKNILGKTRTQPVSMPTMDELPPFDPAEAEAAIQRGVH